MDQVSKRYSDPCFFMNGFISTGRFSEFVDSFMETVGKENEEKTQWEYYLHKVWDCSFADFVNGLKTDKQNQEMSKTTIETTVKNSLDILKNFNPK